MLSTRFDRIVDHHDLRIELERLVDRARGAAGVEKSLDELTAVVTVHQCRRQSLAHLVMVTVEIHPCVIGGRIVGLHQRRIPVVAAKDLVSALAALRDLERQQSQFLLNANLNPV